MFMQTNANTSKTYYNVANTLANWMCKCVLNSALKNTKQEVLIPCHNSIIVKIKPFFSKENKIDAKMKITVFI